MYGPSIIHHVSVENIADLQKTREIIDRDILALYKEGTPTFVVENLPENLPLQTVVLLQNGYVAAGWSMAVIDVQGRKMTLTLTL